VGKINTKILAGIASLAVAAVMLTVGTFAWYTINTEAKGGDLAIIFGGKYPLEASTNYTADSDSAVWSKQIYLDDILNEMNSDAARTEDKGAAPLRPISTFDLEHWYSPEYAGDGSVQTFSEVPLDTIANRPKNTGTDEDGNSVDKGDNCLIYFDMYVRASIEGETWGLKLSTAKKNADGKYGDSLVTEEVDYGTFVLRKPNVYQETLHDEVEDKDIQVEKYLLNNNPDDATDDWEEKDALNSLRIGFAYMKTRTDDDGNVVYTDEEKTIPEEYIERYIIYEPNADVHTSLLSTTADENYVLIDVDEATGYAVKSYNDYVKATGVVSEFWRSFETDAEKKKYHTTMPTFVPKLYDPDDPADVELRGASTLPYVMRRQQTVQQSYSEWSSTVSGMSSSTKLDSSYISKFGEFYPVLDDFGDALPLTTDGEDPMILCDVTYDEPVKIRVFIWLEGQDIDCWNQIMGGDILANFEFVAADPLVPPTTEAEESEESETE